MSYFERYIKIYFWQVISFGLNFLSMFIVTPFLASNPSHYGIYIFCVSISIFLTYADLGFLRSSQKFASENYAKSDFNSEKEHIAFSIFILFIFVFIFSVAILILSFNPNYVLKEFNSNADAQITSRLLFITAIFSLGYVLQRAVQLIYCVRLKEYEYLKINSIFNFLKILSAFFFFSNNKYNIVGYYFTCQILTTIASIVSIFLMKYNVDYKVMDLIAVFKFNKKVFNIEKHLAFSSLYVSFVWILYYEIDSIVIGRFIGISEIAVYSIGFVFITFFRNIFGILYSPFFSRMNYFLGLNDYKGLFSFIIKIATYTAPLTIIPIITICLYAKPLILSWVGEDYLESISIAHFLILCNIVAFVSYPVGNMLVSLQRIKELYIITSILPVIYWGGIFFTFNELGLKSFGLFKLIAFFISGMVYFIYFQRTTKLVVHDFLKNIISIIFMPLLFVFITYIFIIDYLPNDISKLSLSINVIIVVSVIIASFIILYFFSKKMQVFVKHTPVYNKISQYFGNNRNKIQK
jgi:O-antigen/teichoic acid export membrane protein